MKASERSAIVVGGGVIGLASAYRFAQGGWRVTLLDPLLGGGATYAAAGMIAPFAEIAPGEEVGFRQQLGALNAWRLLGDELLELTGEQLRLVERGTLLVGFDAGDRRLINQFVEVAESFCVKVESLTREDDPHVFTGVSARIEGGLFLDGDAWLDPDQAVSLLISANRTLGVEFVSARVIAASSSPNDVSVATESSNYQADVGLFATGAHDLPDGLRAIATTEVRPVRGMTVRVQALDRSDEPMLRAFVRGRPIYIVSRPGGYCVIAPRPTNGGHSELRLANFTDSYVTHSTSFPSLRARPSSKRAKDFVPPQPISPRSLNKSAIAGSGHLVSIATASPWRRSANDVVHAVEVHA